MRKKWQVNTEIHREYLLQAEGQSDRQTHRQTDIQTETVVQCLSLKYPFLWSQY